jgi:hypothetical protein
MNIFRRIIIGSVAALLSLSLILLVMVLSLNAYFSSPAPLKRTLSEAKIYDHIVDAIIKQSQPSQENQNTDDIPFDNQQIQAAAKSAFSPQFLQSSAEQVLDGTSAWLDGTTSEPEFVIDFSTAKSSFIEQVATVAAGRVASLPVCATVEQAGDRDDPFKTTCQPQGFDAATEKQKFIEKANQNEEFNEATTITTDSLTKDSGQSFNEQFGVIKTGYIVSAAAPLILGVIAVISSVLVLLLHAEKPKGLLRLAKIFLSIGVITLISTLVGWFLFSKTNLSFANELDASLQQSLIKAVNIAYATIRNTLLLGSLVYIAIGLVCWFIGKKMQPRLTEEQKQNNINKVLGTKELSDKGAIPLENPNASNDTAPIDNKNSPK